MASTRPIVIDSPPDTAEREPSARPAPAISIQSQLSEQLQAYFASHGQDLPPAGLYERVLQLVEKPLIEQSLLATGGNQLRAAKLLGINRNTLRKKMRQLGLKQTGGPARPQASGR